jgi:hypothetical protein
MSLPPGSQLGCHTIIRLLESGSGGDAYHARDTRLGRDVALKVLPSALTADGQVRQRFEEQARILAALNHAGIAAVYGFEFSGDLCWLVMERVEGRSLAEHLQRGPLPVEEALEVGAQVADVLEAAHDAGLCHLDLRPACIQRCDEGRVKVLDLGLATARHAELPEERSGTSSPDSPTLALDGLTVENIACRSPEQLRGQPLDRRADSWSFGCVVFHCLAGGPPFGGRTVSEVARAIGHGDANWSVLPARTPPAIRDLLERCLEKDRSRRLRDLGDARVVIQRALQRREWASSAEHRAAAAARFPVQAPWVVCAVMALILALGWWSGRRGPAGAPGKASFPARVLLNPAPLSALPQSDVGSLAISPDGRTVLFAGDFPGVGRGLFLRRMDQVGFELLHGQEGWQASDPMLSPDERWAGFLTLGGWKKYPLAGGPVASIAGTPTLAKGATWCQGGVIASIAPSTGLLWVPDSGGPAQILTTPDAVRGEVSHRWPDILPDGRHVLMTIKTSDILTFDDADIAVLDLDTHTWDTIIRGGSYARYAPTGHIVYSRDGALLAAPFDVRTRRVTGPAIKVLDGVMTEPGSGAASFALARQAGTLVYMPGGANQVECRLAWLDRHGRMEDIPAPLWNYAEAAVAPDGRRLLLSTYGASDALFVYDVERGTMTRVTFGGNSAGAAWTPDGRVLYSSDHGASLQMYIADAAGAEARALDIAPLGDDRQCVPLAGGLAVVHTVGGDIWLTPIEPAAAGEALVASRFDESQPCVSPDRRWLAYTSDESGQDEVYVRPFPAGAGKWQVSVGGGSSPKWSARDAEILYVTAERAIAVVPYSCTAGFSSGDALKLGRLPDDVIRLSLHPDGQKFLVVRQLPGRYPTQDIVAVFDWFDELERAVPSAR